MIDKNDLTAREQEMVDKAAPYIIALAGIGLLTVLAAFVWALHWVVHHVVIQP